MNSFKISGNIVDVINKRIFQGTIEVNKGIITSIKEEKVSNSNYILPGFIDAHIHVESSMLIPSQFARLAVVHGTVATVSDPHEIANVLGVKGVKYMIENGEKVNFKFYFGAPSCVPATSFETAGAVVSSDDIKKLFKEEKLHYLSEMMNFPGVLFNDAEVMKKLKTARDLNKPVDGHAPGLKGKDIKEYIEAGISTDHECFTIEEALEKIKYGMKILIREGSAAKNFETLHPLINDYTDFTMLCSDDMHPDNLVESHINDVVKRSLNKGYDLFKVLQVACVNPVKHYNLDVGLLHVNDPADFIVVNDLKEIKVLQTYINGELVAENGKSNILDIKSEPINNFNTSIKSVEDFVVPFTDKKIRVMEAFEGQLITNEADLQPKIENGNIVSDTGTDVLKLTVVNRYSDSKPAVAFIKNIGIKRGAIASSVGHDSHNIIAVGTTDEELCNSVNEIIKHKGGVTVVDGKKIDTLPLPVAGIMSNENGYKVAEDYSRLDKLAKQLGSKLNAPFMTLSFMALLVIPALKLSDKGLFDGNKFEFVNLEV